MGNVFTSVAGNYDLMIDVMSMGLHWLWKDRQCGILCSACNPQGRASCHWKGGAESKAKNETHVHVCDIYPNMLEVGKQHAHKLGLVNVKDLVWMEGDAEALRLEDDNMDGYTIAFGIHNVTHIDHALKEAHRYLADILYFHHMGCLMYGLQDYWHYAEFFYRLFCCHQLVFAWKEIISGGKPERPKCKLVD
ncbi:hypothetical protein CY35_01G000100 [Sphagnum magellanicum]|nr:hypothetical protein CY35_01G000100 [Sphagnum magellanicum]